MISERLLKKWRKEALVNVKEAFGYGLNGEARKEFFAAQSRILKLTQELLDQCLLKERKVKDNG